MLTPHKYNIWEIFEVLTVGAGQQSNGIFGPYTIIPTEDMNIYVEGGMHSETEEGGIAKMTTPMMTFIMAEMPEDKDILVKSSVVLPAVNVFGVDLVGGSAYLKKGITYKAGFYYQLDNPDPVDSISVHFALTLQGIVL